MQFSAIVGEPDRDAGGERDTWLLCGAGSFLYALPLARVVEIMPVLRIDPVAGTPSYIRGLTIIRGTPTPVVDISGLVGDAAGSYQRLVTVQTGSRVIALAVERVLGVRSFAAAEPLPPLLRDLASDIVSAIGHLDNELLLFLGAARIVPDALLECLDNAEAVA